MKTFYPIFKVMFALKPQDMRATGVESRYAWIFIVLMRFATAGFRFMVLVLYLVILGALLNASFEALTGVLPPFLYKVFSFILLLYWVVAAIVLFGGVVGRMVFSEVSRWLCFPVLSLGTRLGVHFFIIFLGGLTLLGVHYLPVWPWSLSDVVLSVLSVGLFFLGTSFIVIIDFLLEIFEYRHPAK